MNKEKISDFVNIWARAIGCTDQKYINIIKSDIAKRCEKYEKSIPTISANIEQNDYYIIKPVNGEFAIEDFFLNRLMMNLREMHFDQSIVGNGSYTAENKEFDMDVADYEKRIEEKGKKHPQLLVDKDNIIKKSIEHEIGHVLKTRMTNGFAEDFLHRKRNVDYEALVTRLASYKEGKYASIINNIKIFDENAVANKVKLGIKDTEGKYGAYLTYLDEAMNEAEAIELSHSSYKQEYWPLQDSNQQNSKSGNYKNIPNYMSGYRAITAEGEMFRGILGKKNVFQAEYISSKEVFERFEKNYSDIAESVFGEDFSQKSLITFMSKTFKDLTGDKHFDEDLTLKMDEFLAKCFERRVEKFLGNQTHEIKKEELDTILSEITHYQEILPTNDDENKRLQLPHNVVLEAVKQKVLERVSERESTTVSTKADPDILTAAITPSQAYISVQSIGQSISNLEIKDEEVQKQKEIYKKKAELFKKMSKDRAQLTEEEKQEIDNYETKSRFSQNKMNKERNNGISR